MGNSTGSMFYMVVILIGAYLIGMLLYEGYKRIKKIISDRKDRRFQDSEESRDKK